VKIVPLTQGQVALVDDDDYEHVMKYKWCASWHKNTQSFRAHGTVDGENVLLSRFIMGANKSEIVDHKNMNTLDDRRSNLRICSRSQNQCNRAKPNSKSSSKYKGVYHDKREGRGQYTAYINLHGKRKHLGCFAKETDAAVAYNEAAQEIHGEFARPNII